VTGCGACCDDGGARYDGDRDERTGVTGGKNVYVSFSYS
jgi:hypothetical protein